MSKQANAGLQAMRAANEQKRAQEQARRAALTPEAGEAEDTARVTMKAQAATHAKRVADANADTHAKASISVAVHWRVSMGWREGGSDALTVRHVCVEAPAGAVRRAVKVARAVRQTGLAKGARFAGMLAVIREDALAVLQAGA